MQKKKLIIASDLDGTIIDHSANKRELARKYGYNLAPHETSSHVMRKIIDRKAYHLIQKELYGAATSTADLMDGVQQSINSLVERFGPVFIISRRGVDTRENAYALEWLGEHLTPPIDEENVFFVEDDARKDEVARKMSVNVYVDDRHDVLDKMPSVEHRYLFYPHEGEVESIYPIVKTWDEFLTICESL